MALRDPEYDPQSRDPNLGLLRGAYRTSLGRSPSQAEIDTWDLSDPDKFSRDIAGSDEARRFAERNVPAGSANINTPPVGGTGGTGGTTPPPMSQLADPNWQAPQYTGGAAASRRAPRLVQRGGQWVLQEHDHERPLQPNEVGDAQRYVSTFAHDNPTGFIQPGQPGYDPRQATTNEAYGPAWLAGADPATNRYVGTSYNMGGFNLARDQDVTRSAKDAFAHAVALGERAGAGNSWQTKEGAQAFATQYIKPYLESQGYQVLGVNGDLINIVTREDREAGNTAGSWFDFVVNAGGDASKGETPMFAWQIQSGTGAEGGGGVGGRAGMGMPTSPQSYRSIFENMTGGKPPSVDNLVALEPQLRQYGMSLVWNAAHTSADVRLPNGQIVDVLQGATGPGGARAWQWLGGDGGMWTPPVAQTTGTTPPNTTTTTPPPTINPTAYNNLAPPTPPPAVVAPPPTPPPVAPPVQPPMANLVPPDPRMV
jgi:hypothetical protein